MIRIPVCASKKYDVIMEQGSLNRIDELLAEAGISGGRKLCCFSFFAWLTTVS